MTEKNNVNILKDFASDVVLMGVELVVGAVVAVKVDQLCDVVVEKMKAKTNPKKGLFGRMKRGCKK